MVRSITRFCSFKKNTFQYKDSRNLADVSIFCKKAAFFSKNIPLLKAIVQKLCYIFLVLFSVFVRWKVTLNENVCFTDYASRIWLPDCSKLVINWKNSNDVPIFRHDVIIKFFWRSVVSLVMFSYWSKFHVNIITGSGVVAISFYKGMIRNPEIGNTPVWVLPNIWRLVQVRDTRFGTELWVINGKPTVKGEVKLLPLPHPSRLEINMKHEVYFVSLEQHWFYFKCPLLLHLYVPGSRNIQNEDLTVSSSKTWFLHTVNFKNNPWKAIGSSFWLLPITSWR